MGKAAPGKAKACSTTYTAPGSDAFFALIKAWREAGDLCGLKVR